MPIWVNSNIGGVQRKKNFVVLWTSELSEIFEIGTNRSAISKLRWRKLFHGIIENKITFVFSEHKSYFIFDNSWKSFRQRNLPIADRLVPISKISLNSDVQRTPKFFFSLNTSLFTFFSFSSNVWIYSNWQPLFTTNFLQQIVPCILLQHSTPKRITDSNRLHLQFNML